MITFKEYKKLIRYDIVFWLLAIPNIIIWLVSAAAQLDSATYFISLFIYSFLLFLIVSICIIEDFHRMQMRVLLVHKIEQRKAIIAKLDLVEGYNPTYYNQVKKEVKELTRELEQCRTFFLLLKIPKE